MKKYFLFIPVFFISMTVIIMAYNYSNRGGGLFNNPVGIEVVGSGNIYVVDCGNGRIQKFSDTGKFIMQWGEQGTGEGCFDRPSHIAADKNKNLYVTDTNNHRIQKFKHDGTFMLTWGNLAMRRARAQFACNFFACGGFGNLDNIGFSTLEEGVAEAVENFVVRDSKINSSKTTDK